MRRTQESRVSASSAAMLNAAIEVIAEQGSRASIMEIGRRSGFSHGLIMSRFGSKAGLLRAVTREVQRRFAERTSRRSPAPTAMAALKDVIDAFLDAIGQHSVDGDAFYVLLGEALGPDPDLRQAFRGADRAFRRLFSERLEEARVAGEIRKDVVPTATAAILVALLRGLAMQLKVDREAFAIADVRRDVDGILKMLDAK